MNRRKFITLLGGVTASWPLAARAQQRDRMQRIGVLMAHAESDPEGQANVAAFREGLQKLGWMEGRNLQIDTRWATAKVESIQRFAKELVALAARSHSFGKHTHHCGAAATNAYHLHHFCERFQSGRRWLARQSGAAGWQCHRFY
jgi:hypothetical protein